jgi:PAS domain S-box-containing protein
MQELAEQGHVPNFYLQLVRKDGTTFPAEASGSLILDRNNQPVAITAAIRDLTERERAWSALRQSEAQYQAVVEASNR